MLNLKEKWGKIIEFKENKIKFSPKLKNLLLIILFNLIFPYVIYLISNINNTYFLELKMFKIESSFIASFMGILYECFIIYGLYLLIYSISKKSLSSNIGLSVILNLISIISFYKISVTQKPFLPEDIFLIGNAFEIAKYGDIKIEPIIIIQIMVTVFILLIQFFITKYTNYEKTPNKIKRVIMAGISLILLFSICFFSWNKEEWLLKEDEFNLQTNYYLYGANVDFFKNIHKLFKKPELAIYDKNKINEIKNNMQAGEENGKEKPNIIVIMAESFSDMTKIKDLKFTSDPIPTFRALSEDNANGNSVVSIYGGETATSEFEFLTATSSKFLFGEKYPYSQIVKGDTNSIVRVLNEKGYYSVAIHPNSGGFYNRQNVYKYLGFQKSVFKKDFEDIENLYDGYVSDMDLANEIIKQYNEMPSDKKFIFSVSIESHTPYSKEKYTNKEIKVTSSEDISKEELELIQTYTKGIKNLDDSLKYLTNYFENNQEEVMIVLFGDHLPLFNELYDKEYGNSVERYETPYIIWTNYPSNIKDQEKLSLAGLSMKMLNSANIELPWYYKYISEFYNEYPVFTDRFIIDKNNRYIDSSFRNELIDNYNIIQYDILYEKSIK